MMNGNVKIGQKAPVFDANTTYGNIKLEDYKGKWLILFSHPGDFTPVCTTEMIAFSKAYQYFKQINTIEDEHFYRLLNKKRSTNLKPELRNDFIEILRKNQNFLFLLQIISMLWK